MPESTIEKGIVNILMKRYNGISGLKGIAILIVIFVHVMVNGNYYINGFVNKDTALELGVIVQLFFMVSAFGMCCGYYDKVKSNNINLNEFYGKRYKKIFPFFALIVLAEVIFSGITKKVLTEAFLDMTLMFGFLPKGNIEVVGVGWTLGVIFAFYILFPFFVFLIWNKRRAWIVFGLCMIMRFGCGAYFMNDGSVVMVNLLLWSTQFIAGGLVFLYKDVLTEKLQNKRLLSGAILLILIGVLISNSLYMKNDGMNKILILCIFSMLIIYAISNKSFVLENKVIQIIGKYCLEVYLAHMMVFRVIEKLSIHKMIGNQIISFIVVYMLTVVVTLIFSIIANYVIDRIGKVFNGRINA